MRSRRLLIWFILAGIIAAAVVADGDDYGSDGIIVTEANLDALLAFKQALEDPQGVLRSWNESKGACSGTWAGIKCARGQVIVIQLAAKGLGGSITSRVGELQALRKLNLHSNRLRGQIPESLASIPSLRSVYLFGNELTGEIPAGLGAATTLQAIDLSRNHLQGTVTETLASSPKLFLLNLAGNNLTGFIPDGWGSSASLVSLVLARNRISGGIPDTWGRNVRGPPLRLLDFSGCRLVGDIPPSLGNMTALEEIRLPGNRITGGLDGRVLGNLRGLRVIDLSSNRINGSLPAALGELSNLTVLDVADNELSGNIPSSLTKILGLRVLNVSDNRLTGRVPAGLGSRFNASSFEGNPGLCGFLDTLPCPSPSPSPAAGGAATSREKRTRSKLSRVSLICIVVGGALALGAAICMLMLVAWRFREQRAAAAKAKTTKNGESRAAAGAAGTSAAGTSGDNNGNGNGNGSGKLVHFDGPFTFTADDLLCATAEVMGKSTYGTVYKATLENGNTVVVKRLREGIVRSQREFETEVNALGRIRHQNLIALRAYYWGPKDEKLLVFDFVHGGSLAAYLHARGPETPLGWTTRMKIALGTARALVYLHDSEKMIHGNLTSSNILLDGQLNAVISDYGLSRLMTSSAGSTILATAGSQGYRAPEVSKLKKGSTKSDVYSFGIVLLELLTGKAPGDAVSTGDGGALDLPEWVSSVVKEEWTSEVFDVELLKGAAPSEDDMLNTLQLAMSCVAAAPSSRPEMAEVLKQLESMSEHKLSPSTSTSTPPAAS